LALAIGILIGKYAFLPKTGGQEKPVEGDSFDEVRAGGYQFISPLLECEPGTDSLRLTGLNPLQKEISSLIEDEKKSGTLTTAAVYFRDLNNGPWFGVNEHESFSPASLLKLPVMLAYYKKSEKSPELLQKKVRYEAKDPLLHQNITPTNSIEKGKDYTIDDLIERMMIYSDNGALTLLEDNIEPALIDRITLDLGVETATEATPEDFMSVKGYSGLFRILYNASYLEKNLSEKALEILSRTEFTKGIVSGVPKSIKVSHKFGERELSDQVKQLHDCGIVYHPKKPYLVCIMTRGDDFSKLSSTIGDISKMIYTSVSSTITK
jgi:beta-lactamase class A